MTTRALCTVPAAYRYFAASARLGGLAMEDYCPITEAFSNWDCRVPPADAAAADAATTQGEEREGTSLT